MKSVSTAIAHVLRQTDVFRKVMCTRALVRDWRRGELAHSFEVPMPDRPGRPDAPVLLSPGEMPKRRSRGSIENRIALLHALAHIEFSAIDLALDAAGRFGEDFPRDYIDDWLSVAADEALHFALLDRHLKVLGSFYGALPAHDGLWEAAEKTAHDVTARLAIVPLVLEARGLDVSPATIKSLEETGDMRAARILSRIYTDEIRHVGIGHKWYANRCEMLDFKPNLHWQHLVKTYFRGPLKRPFNDSARVRAGLTRDYYEPLAG
jgi:uncharacterized ferritin-like protein (DUF455 family)